MKNPLVSIIIPVYNGSNYLKKAIDSALNQTYSNIEIIVVNDGSTDEGKTEEIAKSYGSRIRYIKKENGGVSSALNEGIREMKGTYFSWLSHDDEYYADKIEKQIESLKKVNNPRTVALCGTEFIDEKSNVLNKKWAMQEAGVYSSKEALSQLTKKTFSGIALLIPKSAFDENGLFDESLKYIQDLVMWRSVFLSGYSLVVVPRTMARSRLHSAQQTNNHREKFRQETRITVQKYCEELCEKGYCDIAVELWYALLKKEPKQTADLVKNVLRNRKLLNARCEAKGMAFSIYGKIRPYIRKAYYRLCFGIKSE